MTLIWLCGSAILLILAIVFCALIIAERADEQHRQQLQRDSSCGTGGKGEGHR